MPLAYPCPTPNCRGWSYTYGEPCPNCKKRQDANSRNRWQSDGWNREQEKSWLKNHIPAKRKSKGGDA